MTEILDGKIVHNELTKNAFGGTELIAKRITESVSTDALEDVHIISSRVRQLHDDKYTIYHIHDMATDPECYVLNDPNFRTRIDKIVFVSHWQATEFQRAYNLKHSEFTVIPNMIEPMPMRTERKGEPIRFIYHTTPHRGLGLLFAAFNYLLTRVEDVELHVYSSFNAYGWGERDKPYQGLFEAISAHPKMKYFGFQPNSVVRRAITNADVFAYPNVWPETSCLALIEALAGELYCIHPNFGALPETAKGMSVTYDQCDNNAVHMKVIADEMEKAYHFFRTENQMISPMQRMLFNRYHGIERVSQQWERLLTEIKK
ncbi:putative glycosyltransferase protein [Rhizobium phage RHph_I1_18]|nr:putative glycosyltransferase protein [Rhizobium phage RHph_I1_18]